VFPVKVDTERAGTYLDWEGRVRTFPRVFRDAVGFTDGEVLAMVAREVGAPIGVGDTVAFARESAALGDWNEDRPEFRAREPEPVTVAAGEAVLATWRHLLDLGVMQVGEPYLEATRRPVVARISPEMAESLAVADGDDVTVATDAGSITLPVRLTQMPDQTVWLPTNSQGSQVHQALRVTAGATVRVSAGGAQ
jgi:NADH-quinone oxidoreductase subunit G